MALNTLAPTSPSLVRHHYGFLDTLSVRVTSSLLTILLGSTLRATMAW